MTQREDEILNNIIDVLKKYLDPNQIILFGSRARKTFSRNSDFDLAVTREKVDVKLERQVKEKVIEKIKTTIYLSE